MNARDFIRLEDTISVELLKLIDCGLNGEYVGVPRGDLQGIAEAKAKELINIMGKALKKNG